MVTSARYGVRLAAMRVLVNLLVLACILMTPARAQRLSYREILETYRKGDISAALTALSELTTDDVELAVKTLIETERLRHVRVERAEGRAPTVASEQVRMEHRVWLQAALLLHTEARFALENALAADLRPAHLPHAVLAKRLLAALELPPAVSRRTEELASDNTFLRPWYLLMIAYEQGRGFWPRAMDYVPAARKQCGDHPEMLLAIGAIHEMAWMFEHQEGRKVGVSGDLKEAEAADRGALAGNPQLVEARLRLGRVLTWRGDFDGAVRTLAELRPDTTERGFLYLARLFEGDVLERHGDLDRAAPAYSAAIDALPASPSARIALAHLRHLEGKRSEAADRVTAVAAEAKRTDDGADPWLWYLRGTAWRAPAYLDVLRAMVKL
jgi:tetratricopeptide (TPR) repeat protein